MAVEEAPPAPFFVAGGTVPPGSPSYVERAADRELFDALLAGEFCYVLNSRQMGKSSLAVRTIARLNQAGVRTAFVDLTRLGGTTLTPEQWYSGLLLETGRALGLRSEAAAWLKEHREMGPPQRFLSFLHERALASPPPTPSPAERLAPTPGPSTWEATPKDSAASPASPPSADPPGTSHAGEGGRIVLMVDEIDAVRSLPFSTDELFAGLRQLHNGRASDPALRRLTVCLLGAALPSDLIRDPRATPFNVGRRVELRDFTPEEARPFASQVGEAALARVLFWTGGHPFLTQALCGELASASPPSPLSKTSHLERGSSGVDALVRSRYLDARARETDTNLADVGRRRLGAGDPDVGEKERADTLSLYDAMLRGKSVADDEASPPAARIKMSGVARLEGGKLKPRNRIYATVFGRAWVREAMPGGELRRQKKAFWRGVLRTGLVSAAVLAVVSTLAAGNAREARRQRDQAQYELYAAKMNLLSGAWEHGDLDDMDRLLAGTRASRFRGWEWNYWDAVAHEGLLATIQGNNTLYPRFSPDGNHVAVVVEGTLRLYEISPFRLEAQIPTVGRGSEGLGWLPDGRHLVEFNQGTSALVDPSAGRRVESAQRLQLPALAPSISPDERWALASSEVGQLALLWDLRQPRAPLRPQAGVGRVWGQCFAPDGDRIASVVGVSGGDKLTVRAFPETRRVLWSRTSPISLGSFAWGRGGELLAACDYAGTLTLYDAKTGAVLDQDRLATTRPINLVFSHDGAFLLASYYGDPGAVFRVAGRRLARLRSLRSNGSLDLSSDGSRIIESDLNVRIYRADALLHPREATVGSWGAWEPREDGTALVGTPHGTVLADPAHGTIRPVAGTSRSWLGQSAGSRGLATVDGDPAVVDLRTGSVETRLPHGLHPTRVRGMGAGRAAICTAHGVQVWGDGQPTPLARLPADSPPTGLDYAARIDTLAFATWGGRDRPRGGSGPSPENAPLRGQRGSQRPVLSRRSIAGRWRPGQRGRSLGRDVRTAPLDSPGPRAHRVGRRLLARWLPPRLGFDGWNNPDLGLRNGATDDGHRGRLVERCLAGVPPGRQGHPHDDLRWARPAIR